MNSIDNNPLKIKEPDLLKWINRLEYLLKLNQIEYLLEYNSEKVNENNPYVFISIDYNDEFSFGSCRKVFDKIEFQIFNEHRESYYLKEGFSSEFISSQEDIWTGKIYSVAEFLIKICKDFDGKLKLE